MDLEGEERSVAPDQGHLWSGLRELYDSMSPGRRVQFYFVLALMIAGAFAEIATIGAVLPFLSLLADPSRMVGRLRRSTALSGQRRNIRCEEIPPRGDRKQPLPRIEAERPVPPAQWESQKLIDQLVQRLLRIPFSEEEPHAA